MCLPHAGGSATAYFGLSKALAPEVEVVAVQYPGRQDRRAEPCVDDLGALADHVADALPGAVDPGRPLVLFGHSMGAIVAFEVARRLEARAGAGPRPAWLFASGRRAPSRYRPENVHRRGAAALRSELVALDGTNARLLDDPEVMAMFLPALEADYRAIETYRSEDGATVACPVTALVGSTDPRTSLDEAKAWADHTTAAFDLHVFEGGHFFLDAHLGDLADLVLQVGR